MTHTLLVSRHGASRARREISGNVGSYKVSSYLLRFPFAFQSPQSCRPSMCANSGLLPFRANDVGKIGGNHSLHALTRANIPTSPYGLRRFRANGTRETGKGRRA